MVLPENFPLMKTKQAVGNKSDGVMFPRFSTSISYYLAKYLSCGISVLGILVWHLFFHFFNMRSELQHLCKMCHWMHAAR